jgi:hypothetical protein
MTEAEWLACTAPGPMLDFLGNKASERKLRLYAAACCRQVWHFLCDERSRVAVEAAERYADGLLSEEERDAAFRAACDASLEIRRSPDRWPETDLRLRRRRDPYQVNFAAFLAAFAAGSRAGEVSVHIRAEKSTPKVNLPDQPTRVRLLRCIFGDPFRAIPADPAWVTPSVALLARVIYDDRAFDRLPILADALEEAGCAGATFLDHCRGPGPHALGCWVVDLILGRK